MSRPGLNVVEVKLKEDPLRTKYDIRRENEEIKVVLTVEALENGVKRLPIRYALVVDVSGSMDNAIGRDPRSLIERMKYYAGKLIDRVSEEDSIAVISFAYTAKVELPMTQMKLDKKDHAKELIQKLYADGITNIWDGLQMALNEIDRTATTDAPGSRCQDCIILFTDGIANSGPTHPTEVVRLYRTREKAMNQKSSVHVSAISIGSDQNDLLESIAEELGFEASYWLNEDKVIEADMFLPIILREQAGITDVDLTISALLDTELLTDRLPKSFQKNCSTTEVQYFIPSMAVGQVKHIYLPMKLPEDEDLIGERIVLIQLKYLDAKKRVRAKIDNVSLTDVTLEAIREQAVIAGKTFTNEAKLPNISAYSFFRDERKETWDDCEESLKTIANEDCRVLATEHIKQTRERLRGTDTDTGEDRTAETLQQFANIAKMHERLTGGKADFFAKWEKRVKRSDELTT